MNNNNNKYFVCPCGWQGMSEGSLLELAQVATDDVFDTYEEALERVDYYWEEELAPDECCYVVHPNGYCEEL